jgi:N-acetylneuraminate epimerase
LGLLGSAAVSPDGLRAVFLGGVNKAIFDGFSRDLAGAKDDLEQHRIRRAYMEMRPQDYFFTSDVLAYAPDTNSWQSLGRQPHAATVGSGVALKLNEITLINGEIKPGLRSNEVKRAAINTSDVSWLQVPDLVPGYGQQIQEGLAGVFAGYYKDVLLVAGGANFPGAWQRIRAGNNYAHEGLEKKWYTDIYALVEGRWRVAGRLPTALAYGLTFETDDGLLLIGGEQAKGGAMQTVLTLAWCQSGVQGLTDDARERVVHTSN